jgi:DnaJ domain
MAKIHTHYDNLKVARLAPQEVIRAAYKALSQKYHPDKNPGDEKAARIMAIVNSAYGILSDPVRRKEHDEWIAAEEWEVEWLESTRADEARERQRADAAPHAWEPRPVDAPAPYKVTRDPKWWFALGACFAAGCVVGVLVLEQPRLVPVALASALAGKVNAGENPALAASADKADAVAEVRLAPEIDSWAASQPNPQPPQVRASAVTELIVPRRAPDCETELRTLTSPSGEPWPSKSGYVEGYPIGNRGEEMQLLVDNSANSSPVFAKVYDLERRSNVRHVFVQAGASLVIEKLAAGRYEVRYQNVDVGADHAECAARKKTAFRQAGTAQPEL